MAGRALTERTRQRARDTFLAELAQRGNVSAAAAAAGLSRVWFYQERKDNEAFAAAWDDALETAIDAMELEARRRAVEGTQRPIVGRVGKDQDGILKDSDGNELYIKEYSDGLMIKLLQAHRPEKFRERTDVHHTGEVVKVYAGFDPDKV